jgi:GNAT superfamily N-acetyltransferase
VAVDSLRIRRATPDDRDALAAVARASKAHWGYDEAFMRRVDSALVPDVTYLTECPVYLVEREEAVLGFYGFQPRDGVMFLEDMWVTPAEIGSGVGRMLWSHAVETARANGYTAFSIESDPNAEGFYRRNGATRTGEIISAATGRALPLMNYEIPDAKVRGAI